MKRFLIFAGVGVAIIAVVMMAALFFMRKYTKSFSPEENTVFTYSELTIKVFYNRPFKKGREIFGKLVPYNVVWRTGANEATTFETNKSLNIEGKILPAGKYSLWTIPGENSWTIIFNSEYGQWGINSDGEANRDPARDVLTVEVAAVHQENVIEQFTIAFHQTGDEAEMVLMWDQTIAAMPFTYD
ncbi:MAG TPA: DUF2911 domain-containing protein [Cyclobacteriaceae bacterium]|nr:DUF2911 domain-containing protein [Cyclobacteriaceae bacterium]